MRCFPVDGVLLSEVVLFVEHFAPPSIYPDLTFGSVWLFGYGVDYELQSKSSSKTEWEIREMLFEQHKRLPQNNENEKLNTGSSLGGKKVKRSANIKTPLEQ